MRSGAMELFREFAVCTVSPPVVLTTTPIWVSSQPAHGPWANGKPPSELQCHWGKSPCEGGFNLRLALAWQSSGVFCYLQLYAGHSKPCGVGGACFRRRGGAGPREENNGHVPCGLLWGCGANYNELASALRWRGVFGYMPAEGGRCMQAGEVQAGATA